ncbi:pyruvate kinase [Clostridium peptidivorans]|uniref:pyruvate kinase n=1 Tax=Clostridium peptidivorans TaxID=100174 RepID=UPI000BE3DAC4|nr:pyruvate kinase [Clostridium peptidivorans]
MYIIASIGPKVNNIDSITNIIENGANVLRFNFSHIDYRYSEDLIKYVKSNYPHILIMADIQGSKIRISDKFKFEIKVYPGQKVDFYNEKANLFVKNDRHRDMIPLIPLKFNGISIENFNGKKLLMKDGTMEFDILQNKNSILHTIVRKGGILRREKGINIPGVKRKHLRLNYKDKEDIKWALINKMDIICLSYCSVVEQIIELKNFINTHKGKSEYNSLIWAKLEEEEGIKNSKDILKVADGVVIGRGDLISEVDIAKIPLFQEKIIKNALLENKDVIIATYVLNSMKNCSNPNISEVNDIYNFITRKVTGFLLASEVSVGKYPMEPIKFLNKMINFYNNNIK